MISCAVEIWLLKSSWWLYLNHSLWIGIFPMSWINMEKRFVHGGTSSMRGSAGLDCFRIWMANLGTGNIVQRKFHIFAYDVSTRIAHSLTCGTLSTPETALCSSRKRHDCRKDPKNKIPPYINSSIYQVIIQREKNSYVRILLLAAMLFIKWTPRGRASAESIPGV